jgi:hypothetical protein
VEDLTANGEFAVREKILHGRGPAAQHRFVAVQRVVEDFSGRETIGVFNGGLGDLGKAHGAELLQREHHPVEHSRRGGGKNSLRRNRRLAVGCFPGFERAVPEKFDGGLRGRRSDA